MGEGPPPAADIVARFDDPCRAVRVADHELCVLQLIPGEGQTGLEFLYTVAALQGCRVVRRYPLHRILLLHGDCLHVHRHVPSPNLVSQNGRDLKAGNAPRLSHGAPLQAGHCLCQLLLRLHLLIQGKERAVQIHGLPAVAGVQEQGGGKGRSGTRADAHHRIDARQQDQPVGTDVEFPVCR